MNKNFLDLREIVGIYIFVIYWLHFQGIGKTVVGKTKLFFFGKAIG